MLRKQAAPVSCRLIAVRRLSGLHSNNLGPTNRETVKRLTRAFRKSERDERMSITMALTPVREYMGGFTRPTEIRASNWFPGGRYLTEHKPNENPSVFAYEPHTIFLLESRYDIQYGVGRVDAPAHIVGICRTSDFEEVVKMFNSRDASGECIEYMDNARWPWLKPKPNKPIVWWESKEEKEKILDEIRSGLTEEESQTLKNTLEATTLESDQDLQAKRDALQERKDLRRQIVQTAAVAERVSEEQELSSIDTDIKPLQGKVPFEVEFEDGRVQHPSGFEPPTPADKYRDHEYHLSPHPASKIAAALRRRHIASASEHHSDSSLKVEQWAAAKGRTPLMPELTDGILTGGFKAATQPKDAKIPTEIHGVLDKDVAQPMQHASGFVPPTSRMARGETVARTHIVPGEHATTEPPTPPERWPTFASGDAAFHDAQEAGPAAQDQSVTADTVKAVATHNKNIGELRAKYFEHIKDEPFWRPLLSITTSTRPLAQTLARLSRGLSRGRPFVSMISLDDRKTKHSYAARMRSLRIDRMRTLATEMAQLLAGARGGLVGIRFGVYERGRGIEGEGLDKPIEWKKRVIGVGVGDWYNLSDEVVESFNILGKEEVADVFESSSKEQKPFLVYKFDDWGKPTESLDTPWPAMDLMTDEIREGFQVNSAIAKLEQLMTLDGVTPHKTYVAFDLKTLEKFLNEEFMEVYRNFQGGVRLSQVQPLLELSKNTELPLRIGMENGALPDLTGYVVLHGNSARRAVATRIDALYDKYMKAIALVRVMRARGVLYPSTSTLYKDLEGKYVSGEIYDASLKSLERKWEQFEEDEEDDMDDDEPEEERKNA